MIEEITRLTSQLANYLQASQSGKVIEYKSPAELRDELQLSLPAEGVDFDQLLDKVRSYLHYSMRTAHPMYFNQLWAGFSKPSFFAELVTAASNTSMYTYEVAPVATLLEHFMVGEMGRLMGMSDPEGLFVTGGSNGNLIAVLTARNAVCKTCKFSGLTARKPLEIFVSDQAHYSYKKAANTTGIGMDHVIAVTSDGQGRMDPRQLKLAIQKSIADGNQPLMVGATAGTTVLGAFDPLPELGAVAKEYGLWFHVDAALGGSVVLSRKHQQLMQGSELADSIAWDWHKMLGLPLMCSAFLVKQRGSLLNSVSTGHQADEEYIFHDKEGAELDLGPLSLQCGRRVDVLKLWFAWLMEGSSGFEQRVDRYFDMAQYAAKRVTSEACLELVKPVQSVAICFRYIPTKQGLDVDQLNQQIRENMLKRGDTAVNYATVDGKKIIRLITVNPQTTESHLDTFFDMVIAEGKRIENEES